MKKKMKNKKICIISLFLMLLCSLIAVNYTFFRFTRSNFFYGRDGTTYLSSYVSDVKFSIVKANEDYAVAVADNGTVYMWGNIFGVIEKTTPTKFSLPNDEVVSLNYSSGKTTIGVGTSHVIVVSENGNVYTAGYNGIDEWSTKKEFILIPSSNFDNKKIVAVSTFFNFNLALAEDGSVYGWGANTYGCLGLGSQVTKISTPTKLSFPNNELISKIYAGGNFSYVVSETGNIYVAGANHLYQLGFEGDKEVYEFTSLNLTYKSNIKDVALGSQYTLISTNDGTLYLYGNNDMGQLGYNKTPATGGCNTCNGITSSYLNGVVVDKLFPNKYNTFVLDSGGNLYGFGYNYHGQLGINNNIGTDNQIYPTKIQISNIKQVSSGNFFSVFLNENGQIYIAGQNNYGQLGIGTKDSKSYSTPNKLNVQIEDTLEFDENLNIDEDLNIIKGLEIGKTLNDIKEKIDTTGFVNIYDHNDNKLQDGIIATGYKVNISLYKRNFNYTLSVNGDVTGDGSIKMGDIMKVANQILDNTTIVETCYLKAADITDDGQIKMSDVMKLANIVLEGGDS